MYTIESDPKTTAKACARNLRISCKHSVEVAKFIKGMKTESAKRQLAEVTDMKRAVPFRVHNDSLGHRKGMGPGRYPVTVAEKFIELIESAEKNAEYKGLDTKKLKIKNVSANLGARFQRPRRSEFRGQKAKSTNVSIILEESK